MTEFIAILEVVLVGLGIGILIIIGTAMWKDLP